MELDPLPGAAAPVGLGWHLQDRGPGPDRAVTRDPASVLEAADPLDAGAPRQRSPGRGGVARGDTEALVVPSQVAGQKGVGAVAIVDTGDAQLTHEPVLQGAQRRSTRPFAWGLRAAIEPMPSSAKVRPSCVGTRVSMSCPSSVRGVVRAGSKMLWRSW